MNEIVNKFLLAWDRCIPEIDFKKSAALDKSPFTYRPGGPFTKNKELKNLKKQKIHDIFIKTN